MLSCGLNVFSIVRHLGDALGTFCMLYDSCRFLFQMVRVSSQAQSFLFLFTSMCLVIS